MQNQSGIWLNVRRDRPNWMIMWGWGAMNPTAVQEAAKTGFPLDHFIGVWWSGSEDDARPAGAGGKGYLSLNFNQVGPNFTAIQDIQKLVIDKGKSQTQKDKVGENFYNRGVMNAAVIAEAIRNAQKITGKKDITGEEMRRGLESLQDHARRAGRRSACPGFAAPIDVTCDDHNGHNSAYVQQWDGTKWVKVVRLDRADEGQGHPADRPSGRQDYVQQERRLAEAHRGLRQVVVRRGLKQSLSPPSWRGEALSGAAMSAASQTRDDGRRQGGG